MPSDQTGILKVSAGSSLLERLEQQAGGDESIFVPVPQLPDDPFDQLRAKVKRAITDLSLDYPVGKQFRRVSYKLREPSSYTAVALLFLIAYHWRRQTGEETARLLSENDSPVEIDIPLVFPTTSLRKRRVDEGKVYFSKTERNGEIGSEPVRFCTVNSLQSYRRQNRYISTGLSRDPVASGAIIYCDPSQLLDVFMLLELWECFGIPPTVIERTDGKGDSFNLFLLLSGHTGGGRDRVRPAFY